MSDPAPQKRLSDYKLTVFQAAYFDAVAFTDCSSADDEIDNPGICEADFSQKFIEESVADCEAFVSANESLLDQAYELRDDYGNASAGDDFWLTRNGHGAGFWDRGLGAVGKQLSDAAHVYGGVDIYLGDNGLIYGS